MLKSILIAGITCVLLIASIIFFPKIKAGKMQISTYIVVSLTGAIFMLLLGVVNFEDIFKAMTSEDSVNPIKILILFF